MNRLLFIFILGFLSCNIAMGRSFNLSKEEYSIVEFHLIKKQQDFLDYLKKPKQDINELKFKIFDILISENLLLKNPKFINKTYFIQKDKKLKKEIINIIKEEQKKIQRRR